VSKQPQVTGMISLPIPHYRTTTVSAWPSYYTRPTPAIHLRRRLNLTRRMSPRYLTGSYKPSIGRA